MGHGQARPSGIGGPEKRARVKQGRNEGHGHGAEKAIPKLS